MVPWQGLKRPNACCVMSCHVTHVMLRRTVSCRVRSCHATSHRIMLYQVVSCYVAPSHVVSCRIMSCNVISSALWHVISSHALSCYIKWWNIPCLLPSVRPSIHRTIIQSICGQRACRATGHDETGCHHDFACPFALLKFKLSKFKIKKKIPPSFLLSKHRAAKSIHWFFLIRTSYFFLRLNVLIWNAFWASKCS